MTPLKPEHQGEGTYDYACRDAGCWYCEAMKPQLIVDDPEIPIFKQTGHGYAWTKDEIDTLMNNMHLSYVSLVKLLPGRTPVHVVQKRLNYQIWVLLKRPRGVQTGFIRFIICVPNGLIFDLHLRGINSRYMNLYKQF